MVRESIELIRCSSVDSVRREVPGEKIACSVDTSKSSFVGDNDDRGIITMIVGVGESSVVDIIEP